MKKKKLTVVLKSIGAILLIIILAVYTVQLIKRQSGDELPDIFGYSSAVVITGSMADTINVNDYIIIKEESEYLAGDIITFQQDGTIITHRIVEVTENGFITKGDANNTCDDEITLEQIEGKVVAVIPNLGDIIYFFKTSTGIYMLIGIGVILLILNIVFKKTKETENESNK
jgi:signal peptidase